MFASLELGVCRCFGGGSEGSATAAGGGAAITLAEGARTTFGKRRFRRRCGSVTTTARRCIEDGGRSSIVGAMRVGAKAAKLRTHACALLRTTLTPSAGARDDRSTPTREEDAASTCEVCSGKGSARGLHAGTSKAVAASRAGVCVASVSASRGAFSRGGTSCSLKAATHPDKVAAGK